ncbi:response regulator [Flaviaesturariibacter flavus]|uniref:Response regulator n=1 Tax=Flaviaesturariibacter flavus TaxID=2502780 RepID=A0A4V2NVQ8_9BACT|nr:response regulator [Flaviaesturariibacter flavus]TCJ14432.1 response regulator [Flaviaesturariibacter flavus]
MMQPNKILLVDDDSDDREMLISTLAFVNPQVEIDCVRNGLEALDYLDEMRSSAQKLPCLIVLDINMPLLDGKATFERIQHDEVLRSVPVVVLTSSANPVDKEHFQRQGAVFFTKPDDYSFLKKISVYLLSVCCRPFQPVA